MKLPVARVALNLPLPNLDHPFDYLVPPELDIAAQPGVRVKVRFAGQLRDGFITARLAEGDRPDLTKLHKVVSNEPVLSQAADQLIRAVADHYCGVWADVARAAIPPRHAATEKAATSAFPDPQRLEPEPGPLTGYPGGSGLLDALAKGQHPRAAWSPAPSIGQVGDWAQGFLQAAAATLAGGRGVVLLVPDARHLTHLRLAAAQRFGKGSFVTLAADSGPAARYRSFLAVSRGQVRLVIGTRAAVFAPVADLGLIAVWDEGNDAYADPHAPYWNAREVATMRAHLQSSGLLLAGYGRSAQVAHLAARGWLVGLQLQPADNRRVCAAVRATAAEVRGSVVRLPHQVFTVARSGLSGGPVLIQVARAGYLPVLLCSGCRTRAACPTCGQGLSDPSGKGPTCRWCGPLASPWRCPTCQDHRLRAAVAGVSRTAEELGRAFPGTPVRQASADTPLASVPETPSLVLATAGATPIAAQGYQAALILDADQVLSRPELGVGEEALRRWLSLAAMVRPAQEGGTLLVVGDPTSREVQALLRLDPVGYANRELQDRIEAGLPPAAKLITLEGPAAQLVGIGQELRLPNSAVLLGPFELHDTEDARLTIRAPLAEGAAVLTEIRRVMAGRAARKDPPIRVRVDPTHLS